MRKFFLLLTLLSVVLASCAAEVKAQQSQAQPAKATQSASLASPTAFLPIDNTPAAEIIPPTLTPAPPAQPRTWPAPFTYGKRSSLPTAVPPPMDPYYFSADTTNILLLGSDRRSGRYFRTDTILILSIQPSSRGAALISVPRDLYVYLPGYTMNRVNTAWLYGELYDYPGGGVAMLYDTILYNLGIRIDHYALVEMSGFSQLIDALGGVDVRVTCAYTDWRLKSPDLDQNVVANWELYTVQPGVLHMDGDLALWYARSRKRSSDFDRARRQQEVLRAAYRQILSLGLIPRLPEIYQQLTGMVSTDMTLGDMLRLVPDAARLDFANLRSRFIGREQTRGWTTPTGGAVQLPNIQAIQLLLDQTFDFSQQVMQENPVTIEVLNVSSHADWDVLAGERLTYAGYEVDLLPDAPNPGTTTHLIDLGLAPGESDRLARMLGLNSSAIVELPDPYSTRAFRLVVGNDYNPCFNPTKGQGW
jgi:LCP family protein required for cell wall assembly